MSKPRPTPGLRAAIAWVLDNKILVLGEDANGRIVYHWDRALSPCPSNAAKSYMEHAAKNPSSFHERIVPMFLGEEDGLSEEATVHDKKLVNTIRAVLRRFTETMPEASHVGKNHSEKEQAETQAAESPPDGALQSGQVH